MLEAPLIDFDVFHRSDLPARLAGPRGREAADDLRGAAALALALPDGRAYTYTPREGAIEIAPGAGEGAAVVELSLRAWSDLAQEIRTVPALIFAGDLKVAGGNMALLRRWQPALRALYSDVPIYDPARVDLTDAAGRALDLQRSFTLSDPSEDIALFFRRTGFLHLRRVFADDEIGACGRWSTSCRAPRARATTAPGGRRTQTGARSSAAWSTPGSHSPRIARLVDDPRLRRIVELTGLDVRPAIDRQEGQAVVIKNPGIVEGLSDLPWHQDCGLGGHPITCPGIGIGVQLEAATPESGQLHVIAGSHGSSCHPFDEAQLAALPHVALTTEPGDCTVHIKDLMHAAPPPRGKGRRTLYVSFSSPRMFEAIGPGEAYNDIVRRRRADGHVAHTDEVLSGGA